MPCTLRAIHPKTNGDFQLALEQTSADWADCAAKVDQHILCNQKSINKSYEKTD